MTHVQAAEFCWMATEKSDAHMDLDKRADVVDKCIAEKMGVKPAETKPGAKPGAKPESKPKPKAKTESKPETKPETKPKTKPKPKSGDTPEANPETK